MALREKLVEPQKLEDYPLSKVPHGTLSGHILHISKQVQRGRPSVPSPSNQCTLGQGVTARVPRAMLAT